MSFYVYIIYSSSRDIYYTGYTSDIDKRLAKHNAGATPSTRTGIPWLLKYSESFDSKTEAIKRELAIKKKKSRFYIESLISSSESHK